MRQKEKKEILPGTIIHEEKPFVHILSSKVRSERCDYCFEKKSLRKCSGCQYVYYCGRVCQKDDWEIHKKECENLKRISPRILPDAARTIGRIIIKLQNGGDLQKGYYTKSSFRKFKDLMSHYSDIKEDTKRMEHFTSLCGVLAEYLHGVQMPNSADLLGIYGRLVVNGFNILDPEMTTIGTGIYLGATVIDHSCTPNALAVFEGTTIYIRTLELIPAFDWDQVFISYVDLLDTPTERQKNLQSNYYFLCQCSLCLDTKFLKYMYSSVCPNSECNSILDMTDIDEEIIRCEKCKDKISMEFKTNYRNIADFTACQVAEMKDIIYLDLCKICLKKQEGILHPLNILHVKTLDLAFEACIQIGNWDYAIEIATQLLLGYRKYYSKHNPLLGLFLVKIGKILLYKGKSADALKYFKEAHQILMITHGQNHSFYKDSLLPLMYQANQESSFM